MSKTFLKEIEFNKIMNTLLEPIYGLFYRRNYNVNDNTPILINDQSFGLVKNILNTIYVNEKINDIYRIEKKNTYNIKIGEYTIILKKKIEKKDLENLNNNIILIHFDDKKFDNKNIFYSKQLLFNLSKHKYVPHIELITDLDNIEVDKIAKIRNNDPLIKFYGFNREDVCKIVYKSNKINNINLYFNYRLII